MTLRSCILERWLYASTNCASLPSATASNSVSLRFQLSAIWLIICGATLSPRMIVTGLKSAVILAPLNMNSSNMPSSSPLHSDAFSRRRSWMLGRFTAGSSVTSVTSFCLLSKISLNWFCNLSCSASCSSKPTMLMRHNQPVVSLIAESGMPLSSRTSALRSCASR